MDNDLFETFIESSYKYLHSFVEGLPDYPKKFTCITLFRDIFDGKIESKQNNTPFECDKYPIYSVFDSFFNDLFEITDACDKETSVKVLSEIRKKLHQARISYLIKGLEEGSISPGAPD